MNTFKKAVIYLTHLITFVLVFLSCMYTYNLNFIKNVNKVDSSGEEYSIYLLINMIAVGLLFGFFLLFTLSSYDYSSSIKIKPIVLCFISFLLFFIELALYTFDIYNINTKYIDNIHKLISFSHFVIFSLIFFMNIVFSYDVLNI